LWLAESQKKEQIGVISQPSGSPSTEAKPRNLATGLLLSACMFSPQHLLIVTKAGLSL
jgi:hypothetical protein